MADRLIALPCPGCATAVPLATAALQAAPGLALACPRCHRDFAAATAVLRLKARAIAPVGDVERPFERPEVLARFAAVWGEEG